MRLNRRDFLQAVAAGAAFAFTPITVWAFRGTGAAPLQALARPDLLGVVGPEAVRAIGVRYRTLARAEDDRRLLRALLAARPPAAAIEDDFVNGRTVVVDGWVLSITEARQCALYSMVAV